MTPPAPELLDQDTWQAREAAHHERVDRYAVPYLARRSVGRKHPVEDFLFTYYTQKPGQLRRWHPGAGVVLRGQGAAERLDWRFYRPHPGAGVGLDAGQFLAQRRKAVDFARVILGRTAARPAQFGCFGLHEWAMVYRQEANQVRHEYLDLRLGPAGTDAVVEESRIRCTHFDAYRFYTPQAAGLNELRPTRENQRDLEQPGCLHANMDLYKWAYKLSPALPSELVMDCFELSWRIRAMDMQASPYDLAEWGYPPIPIETAAGKADYVARQRAFSAEAEVLRARLSEALDRLDAAP
ncbi:3-methyladenine DNA glycosylase [Arthrobacter sp. SDTb3-6]|uniref:3-methyladenine DNA glycosylase n=1 Tax=Arthrobacter sp. SDTb3-6 TaxID=2713571 RepID=UPI00159D02A2|nr:3-methyladenine DNA glycosylase [Arthrobacter sp. SDTb3-6]NVM97324.1 3-methyladenine DNA glycosylase [Arthrobacter sp. SDTb3-6]